MKHNKTLPDICLIKFLLYFEIILHLENSTLKINKMALIHPMSLSVYIVYLSRITDPKYRQDKHLFLRE